MTYQIFPKCLNFEEDYELPNDNDYSKNAWMTRSFFFCLEHVDKKIKALDDN